MTKNSGSLAEQVDHLYSEPAIGASYINTYGEENIKQLVAKFRSLDEAGMKTMLEMVIGYSQSDDLASCFVSVGVLHALGRKREVEAAYRRVQDREDGKRFITHFDIGKSLAEYFAEN